MADIRLQSISKRFGDVEVIPGIDLTMPDGQVTVLLGPSGCGKSTLLRIIAGLETPSGGDVLIGGRVMNDVPPADRGCALVFQNYALYPHKTVRQNLAFPLRMAKVDAAQQQRSVDDIARTLELTPLLERDDPRPVIALNTITVRPAAGPATLSCEPLMAPTTTPPIIPVNIPENSGAPDAKAIPRHSGNATKKTTILEGRSFLRFFGKKYFLRLRLPIAAPSCFDCI
jgi:GTPase SAR1 family protein